MFFQDLFRYCHNLQLVLKIQQLVKIFLFYFEVNITFWVKKILTSIIWVEFKIIFCLLYKQASFTTFLRLTQRTNFIFNMG